MISLPLDLLPLILSELFASCTTLEQDANLQSTKLVCKAWLHASRPFDFYLVAGFRELEVLCEHLRCGSGPTYARKRLCVTPAWSYGRGELGLSSEWHQEFFRERVNRLLRKLGGLEELEFDDMYDRLQAPSTGLEGLQNLRRFSTTGSPYRYVELNKIMELDVPRLQEIECGAAQITEDTFNVPRLKVLTVGVLCEPQSHPSILRRLTNFLHASHDTLRTLKIPRIEQHLTNFETAQLLTPLRSLVDLHIPVPTSSPEMSDDVFWQTLGDTLRSLRRLSLNGTRGISTLFDTLSILPSERHLEPPPPAFPLLEVLDTTPYGENFRAKSHAMELRKALDHVASMLKCGKYSEIRPRWIVSGNLCEAAENYLGKRQEVLGRRYGVTLERRLE
ncbi:hypothetical protein P7C70_g2027, partial [Phenoliferia sp. Uapishka_3]